MSIIKQFITTIQQNEFVEGHEVLEAQWHNFKKKEGFEDEAKILKGLINGSTALALACKGKKEGAHRVWNTYEKYAPLIALTNSVDKSDYEEAQKILEYKYTLYM